MKSDFLSVTNLAKQFKNSASPVISNLSFKVAEGEFFAIVGPSGCGKTTVLRLIAGFETAERGKIILDGEDITNTPPHMRPLNMMFQSYALFPHLNARDNIAFGLKCDRKKTSEIDSRIAKMVELLQLGNFLHRYPAQLSAGEKQRIALARSLVKKPKVLLLDEPLANLDEELRQRTQLELVNWQEELGTTFIIVTHDQEEAMTVASRIAVMKEGDLVQVAEPSEIYECPNSLYVANFIGDLNVMDAQVEEVAEEKVVLRAPELADVPLQTWINGWSKQNRLTKGEKISLGLRPEKIAISLTKDPKKFTIQGKVDDISYLGNLSVYHVRLPSGKLLLVTQTNMVRIVERDITWDDNVHLSWNRSSLMLLK